MTKYDFPPKPKPPTFYERHCRKISIILEMVAFLVCVIMIIWGVDNGIEYEERTHYEYAAWDGVEVEGDHGSSEILITVDSGYNHTISIADRYGIILHNATISIPDNIPNRYNEGKLNHKVNQTVNFTITEDSMYYAEIDGKVIKFREDDYGGYKIKLGPACVAALGAGILIVWSGILEDSRKWRR